MVYLVKCQLIGEQPLIEGVPISLHLLATITPSFLECGFYWRGVDAFFPEILKAEKLSLLFIDNVLIASVFIGVKTSRAFPKCRVSNVSLCSFGLQGDCQSGAIRTASDLS